MCVCVCVCVILNTSPICCTRACVKIISVCQSVCAVVLSMFKTFKMEMTVNINIHVQAR